MLCDLIGEGVFAWRKEQICRLWIAKKVYAYVTGEARGGNAACRALAGGKSGASGGEGCAEPAAESPAIH